MKVMHNNDLNNFINSINIRICESGIADIDSGWDRSERADPFSRIYITLCGEGEVISRGSAYKLRRGEIFFIPCKTPIGFRCTGQMRQMYFHVNYTGADGLDIFKNGGTPRVIDGISFNACQTSEPYSGNRLSDATLFLNLATEVLCTALKDNDIPLGRPLSPLIGRITANISELADIQLSLRKYADAAFIDESTLSRRFKSEVGISFSKYVDTVVLNRAACELLNSMRPIKDISSAHGFCDEFYFSRKFKQNFGEAPSVYRKNHRV